MNPAAYLYSERYFYLIKGRFDSDLIIVIKIKNMWFECDEGAG